MSRALLVLLPLVLRAQSPGSWTVVRNGSFEVYSQEGEKSASAGLAWLEELRGIVQRQTGLNPDDSEPLRVIAFRSATDYSPYRLRATADAYYVGSGSRNYLVVPSFEPEDLPTAAHEYAHFLFHLAGLNLPPWLSEGMAEVFSSVRMTGGRPRIGGDLPNRSQWLAHRSWPPLSQILTRAETPRESDRDASTMFYSISWALTEMLAFAPEYRAGFRKLVTAIASGIPPERALKDAYWKSLAEIGVDLRARNGRRTAVYIDDPNRGTAGASPPHISTVSALDMRVMMARVLLVAGESDRAGELYRDLSREAPERGDVTAGLGMTTYAQGDHREAQRLWKRAISQGLADAEVVYQYAILLDAASDATPDELREVLQMTIKLRPAFDDARFRLGLLEENAGRHEAALEQFDAIGNPEPVRAYAYWCARSQALTGLGRNAEAAQAAHKAMESASSASDRSHARELARMAQTHLEVQFTRDAEGNTVLTTTRVANDAPGWNAFVEPDDDLRRAEGTLRSIDCTDADLRLSIDTAAGPIAIAISDPARVQMRNAPPEFTCGAQPPTAVVVDYAAAKGKGLVAGVARGIEFRK